MKVRTGDTHTHTHIFTYELSPITIAAPMKSKIAAIALFPF